jgi:hypothetical protein
MMGAWNLGVTVKTLILLVMYNILFYCRYTCTTMESQARNLLRDEQFNERVRVFTEFLEDDVT